MRVVSLLASGTEIVCALGAGDWLVGRSHECDNPGWVKRLPRCSEPAFDVAVSSGDIDAEVKRRVRANEPLYHIGYDLIRSLEPDVIIAQEHCGVCAVTPDHLDAGGCVIPGARVVALNAASLEEILSSIAQVAEALGIADRGTAVAQGERERLERVRQAVAGRPRPTVAMIEWTDPIYAMANWAPELVDIAGGEPLLTRPGELSTGMRGERVRDADPDFVIVAPCGYALGRTVEDRPVLEAYPWWGEMRAVREGRVAFADGNRFFNRSGMTVAQTAEIIAEILHGVSFEEPGQGRHWMWNSAVVAVASSGRS